MKEVNNIQAYNIERISSMHGMLSEVHDQLYQHYMHLSETVETLKEYLSWL